MNIRKIDGFRFLGFRLTHKSKVIPKELTKYYENKSEKPSFKSWFNSQVKKFIGTIFPNYEVETTKEWRFRDKTSLDYDIVETIKAGTSKNLFFSPDELENMKKLNYLDEIAFLRKLEKEGRFKKPKT